MEETNTTQNGTNNNQNKKRKPKVMKEYQIALWSDGRGFLAKGFGYTLNSLDAWIFTRPAEVRKFIKSAGDNAVGVKIVEFK